MVSMFQELNKSRLHTFLVSSAIIYKQILVDFYSNYAEKDDKVVYSHGDKEITIDQATLATAFSLPTVCIFDFSSISKEDMATAMKKFVAADEVLSPSC